MRSKKNRMVLASLLCASAAVLSFQNCAKTGFTSLSSQDAAGQVASGTTSPAVTDPGVTTPVNNVPTPTPTPTPVMPTPTPTPNPPTVVTCSNAGTKYGIGQSFNAACPIGQTGAIVNTCQASGQFSQLNMCITPAAPPTCTNPEVVQTLNTVIKKITTTEDAIANACADGVVSAAQSHPTNELAAVRFFNTCGNRYCINVMQATSGRVVENNAGLSVVSCTFNVVPPNVSSTCQTAVANKIAQSPWIETRSVSRTTLAQDCVDAAVPNVSDQYPTTGDLYTRWVFSCGNRECRKQGLSAGRVIEDDGSNVTLECTREEIFNTLGGGEVVSDITTTPADVAAACIDGSFTTAQSSLPDGTSNKLLRFMNTCGFRYCANRGFRLGRLTETNGIIASVRCTK